MEKNNELNGEKPGIFKIKKESPIGGGGLTKKSKALRSNKQNAVKTFYGIKNKNSTTVSESGDYIYPASQEDSYNTCAMTVKYSDRVLYYVRRSKYKLFDPYKPPSLHEQRSHESVYGTKEYGWIRTNKECYDCYMQYMKTNTSRWLDQAESAYYHGV